MEALVCNVEEYIAKRLYDQGQPSEARLAIQRAQSLPDDLAFDQLESFRAVPLSAEEVAAREEEGLADAWMNLRSERDGLLAASDWTQLPDVPVDTASAWADYRQALRDLPDTVSDPRAAVWPEAPA